MQGNVQTVSKAANNPKPRPPKRVQATGSDVRDTVSAGDMGRA